MNILVLAKSNKYGNYCLAGLNLDTFEFVRILGSGKNGSFLNSDCTLNNGNNISVLDHIKINLKKEVTNSAQTENYSCISNTALYFGKFSVIDLHNIFLNNLSYNLILKENLFIEKSQTIGYLNRDDYETVSHSLELVKVHNLNIFINNTCSFDFNGKNYRFIKITDPKFIHQSCKYAEALLLISLSGEDDYTLNNDKFYMFVSSIFIT